MPEPITSGLCSASAGNHGPDVRSDCRVTVWESATPGPPHWKLTSKVAALYGDSIRADALSALAALDAADLSIQIEDSGALPFTLLARVETAVRRLRPQTVATVLPPQNPAALRVDLWDDPYRGASLDRGGLAVRGRESPQPTRVR